MVSVARSVQEVESLREAWSAMPRDSVKSDIDYFLWSLVEEPQVVRPHVLAVERNGRIEAILAARLSDIRLPCKLGYSTLYAPKVRAVSVLHDGLLGAVDPPTTAAILDELDAALERRESDVILFRHLELGSPLHGAVSAKSTWATCQHGTSPDLRWEIELPSTPEEYLASLSSATRKGLRRTANRVEQEFGDRLWMRTFTKPADLRPFFDDLEIVAARTYQRRLGVGYLGDAAQRRRFQELMAHGWLRGYILYLDGMPIAFEVGELYRGRFRSLAGGYDPAYGRHRVGAHLLVRTIMDLAGDPDASVYDFGHGHAEYKSKLAHVAHEEADFLLYARRVKPIAINFIRAGLLWTSRVVNGGLRRLDLLDTIKHRRRRRGAAVTTAQIQAPRRA